MAPPEHRATAAPAEPFFLEGGAGPRFCLFHRPAGACRGALVYIHPLAEEMNRTRRMAALASRALAAGGIAVLQVDLHGCGDSGGDFGDASWDSWKADVALAHGWLRTRLDCPVGLWGLRLGALLALDCARGTRADRLLLWQPVTKGSNYLTQVLRLRLAGELLQDGGSKADTAALKAALLGGAPLDVAGYTLSPALALPVDALDASVLVPPCPVHWFEVAGTLSPAATRTIDGWRAAGASVQAHIAPGQQFWATPEITECPALVEATVNACRETADA
ncbi:hydrolase 2, exosortase A system-associated [Massilia terrae]|uniref:Hydrolase 2, exosortase A system-associated n=1 Tax=Massilia terrae TaxID=1811224 RepID=A0ABT2CY94_9BURK|nr:hydrolase 2, exosortase A system-associated [Massilia terrae]MCS0658950.1 hydrolase 2, exosortase A system-associated [Massilia terrae]